MRLESKVVIVTGAARGLGKAYALRLAAEGAKVAVADILESGEVVEAIRAKGGHAIALKTDVTREESTREMAGKTIDSFGRIDVLVNNAAMFATIKKRAFWEIPVEEWDALTAVNLRGSFLCARAVYPQMKKQGKGKIINVASSTFFKGVPYFLHYVTSKGGTIAMSRAMARELGDAGITVNSIAPGYTHTDYFKENPQDPPEVTKAIIASQCIKRPSTTDDMAGTIVFLASDDSDFITGQTIVVDGGSALH